ncbi:MAG: hypothetical protein FWD66_05150 [Paludibacter sp.]|nr:hypothetical protein [Paludibacter sp.]
MKKIEDEIPVYEEEELIKFTLNLLPDSFKGRIDEDKIQYVLDVVYDYYDKKGYIEQEDIAEEAMIDEEEMFNFIKKAAITDKIDLTEEEIAFILDCEYDYGVSIGVYSEQ